MAKNQRRMADGDRCVTLIRKAMSIPGGATARFRRWRQRRDAGIPLQAGIAVAYACGPGRLGKPSAALGRRALGAKRGKSRWAGRPLSGYR
jgi:hypothetical protein